MQIGQEDFTYMETFCRLLLVPLLLLFVHLFHIKLTHRSALARHRKQEPSMPLLFNYNSLVFIFQEINLNTDLKMVQVLILSQLKMLQYAEKLVNKHEEVTKGSK